MKNFLKTKGLKMTAQREVIFRAFFDTPSLWTVEDLYHRVRAIDPAIGYSTVWRTLNLICDVGLGEKKYFADGIVRYDKSSGRPNGKVICSSCGDAHEFTLDEAFRCLQDKADEVGLAPTAYRVEIVGVCLVCRRKSESTQVVDIRPATASPALTQKRKARS